jgi:hypothetical protein
MLAPTIPFDIFVSSALLRCPYGILLLKNPLNRHYFVTSPIHAEFWIMMKLEFEVPGSSARMPGASGAPLKKLICEWDFNKSIWSS